MDFSECVIVIVIVTRSNIGKGGAERNAWEALLDMEKCNDNVEELDEGAVPLVVELAKAFEKGISKWCRLGQCTSASRNEFFGRSGKGTSSTSIGCFFEGCVADPLQTLEPRRGRFRS